MKKAFITVVIWLGCGGGGTPRGVEGPDATDVPLEDATVSFDTEPELTVVSGEDVLFGEPEPDIVDSGTPLEAPFVGTWLDCIGKIRFEEDGRFEYTGFDGQCFTTGYYELTENILTLHRVSSTCPEDETDRQSDFYKDRMVVTVTFERMVWQHPALDTGVKVWIRPGMFRPERFLLLDESESRGQDLRMCIGREGRLIVGFYFTPKGYSSLISGSGRIERREIEGGDPTHLQIRTSCQGPCMCAAILNLVLEDSTITGQYRGINCSQIIGPGSVHGRVIDWKYY